MTVLDTLNFVAFHPLQNNNPIAVRRRKLIAKIDEQVQLAANKDYTSIVQFTTGALKTSEFLRFRPSFLVNLCQTGENVNKSAYKSGCYKFATIEWE